MKTAKGNLMAEADARGDVVAVGYGSASACERRGRTGGRVRWFTGVCTGSTRALRLCWLSEKLNDAAVAGCVFF